MANHSIEDVEKEAAASKAIIGSMLIGLAGVAIKAYNNNNKSKQDIIARQRIQQKISEIDRQISDYKSKFCGSFLYSDEIAELEEERAQLVKEYNAI
ncbi:MAG: hypothetical protein ACI4EA_08785 [Candidatus Ornithomonoglobus sp.]